jgi:hypothetical protein
MATKSDSQPKRSKFLFGLSAILAGIAVLFFFLGLGASATIVEAVQSLFSSLSAEIIGALITIWLFDNLLERQRERSLQGGPTPFLGPHGMQVTPAKG